MPVLLGFQPAQAPPPLPSRLQQHSPGKGSPAHFPIQPAVGLLGNREELLGWGALVMAQGTPTWREHKRGAWATPRCSPQGRLREAGLWAASRVLGTRDAGRPRRGDRSALSQLSRDRSEAPCPCSQPLRTVPRPRCPYWPALGLHLVPERRRGLPSTLLSPHACVWGAGESGRIRKRSKEAVALPGSVCVSSEECAESEGVSVDV